GPKNEREVAGGSRPSCSANLSGLRALPETSGSVVVGSLAVRGDVQPLAFLVAADAQADGLVDQEEQDHRNQRAPADADAGGDGLGPHLRAHVEAFDAGAAQRR